MTINKELGTCPKCHGTCQIPVNPGSDGGAMRACDNCGAQRMYGRATGTVNLRRDTGEPCLHEYVYYSTGYTTYATYKCRHCDSSYNIDSSG